MALKPFSRARAQTLDDLGGCRGIAIDGGGGLIGAVIGGAMNGLFGAFIGGFMGFSIPALGLFLFNLYTARGNYWKERAADAEAKLSSASAVIPVGAQPVPERDWRLSDLFHHIRPDVTEEHDTPVWRSVGAQVRQAFADGLRVWGRECNANGLRADDELPSLVLIPSQRWAAATFMYNFFDDNSERNAQVKIPDPVGFTHYADLRISRGEALKIFPDPGLNPNAGHWDGRTFVYDRPRHIWTKRLHEGHEHTFVIPFPEGIPARARVNCQFELTSEGGSFSRMGFGTDRISFDDQLQPQRLPAILDDNGRATLFFDTAMDIQGRTLRIYANSWELPE